MVRDVRHAAFSADVGEYRPSRAGFQRVRINSQTPSIDLRQRAFLMLHRIGFTLLCPSQKMRIMGTWCIIVALNFQCHGNLSQELMGRFGARISARKRIGRMDNSRILGV